MTGVTTPSTHSAIHLAAHLSPRPRMLALPARGGWMDGPTVEGHKYAKQLSLA